MYTSPAISQSEFAIDLDRDKISVTTSDYISFELKFSDGQIRVLSFEINHDMDVSWFFVTASPDRYAKDLGRLIEKKLWPE